MLAPTTLNLSGERFSVVYHIVGNHEEVMRKAEDICVEQTIEFPADLVPDDDIRSSIIGRIEEVEACDNNTFRVRISYAVEIVQGELTQFLNVIFGNISLKPGIRVQDLHLPEALLRDYRGPRFGISGVRSLVGVSDRPLLCTAIKPMGLSVAELSRQTYEFALGGVDIIKDDHGLTDQSFAPYRERVSRCVESVQKANQQSGRVSLYAPNVTAPGDQLFERAYFAKQAGAGALLVSPGIVGFDRMQALADDDRIALPLLYHPTFLGSFVTSPLNGISHRVIFGLIGRLAGADIVIFPNFGGRFSFSREECLSIAQAAREPLGHLKPIFPAPAGGMKMERIAEMMETYGKDVILLIGGDLHRHPQGLQKASQLFRESVLQGRRYSWQSDYLAPTIQQ